jgi:hypothetical protein
VRHVGPAPLDKGEPPRHPEVVIECVTQPRWSCERRAGTAAELGAIANPGTVSINHEGVEFAAGRWLATADGSFQFRITEVRPLVPGAYQLVIHYAARRFGRAVQITQALTTPNAHNGDT